MPTVFDLIEHLQSRNGTDPIAHAIWTRAKDIGCKITKKQAVEILEEVHRRQDCSIGINWDVLDNYIIDSRATTCKT